MKIGILKLIYIQLSKIYIHFYKEKRDYWQIFPVLAISLLVTLNLQIISLYFRKGVDVAYFIIMLFALIFFLTFKFKNIEYNFVKDYPLSTKTKIVTGIFFVIDLIVIFFLLESSRSANGF